MREWKKDISTAKIVNDYIYLSGRNYSRVDEQVFGTVSTNDTLSCVRFHAGLPLISFTVFPFFERHSRSSDKIGLQLSNFFANRFFSSGTITRRWFRRNISHRHAFTTDPSRILYLFKHDDISRAGPRFRFLSSLPFLSSQKLRSLSLFVSPSNIVSHEPICHP